MGTEGRAGGWEKWLRPGPGTLSKTVTVGCSSNGGDRSPRPAPLALCEPRGWGSTNESTGFSASQVPGTLGPWYPSGLGEVPPPCPPEGLCAAHSDRAPLGRRPGVRGPSLLLSSCEGHLIPNTASQSCPGSRGSLGAVTWAVRPARAIAKPHWARVSSSRIHSHSKILGPREPAPPSGGPW